MVKTQNFLQGAGVLLLANLAVKVIGAVFQIPLKNMIGSDGFAAFGLFSVAYRMYLAMLLLSTVGLPAAISKMIAEAKALGQAHTIGKIMCVASGVFIPFGALCSYLLFAGADAIAGAMQNYEVAGALRAIAPAVFFVAILSVLRGYYQGQHNMIPTAMSQVIEALGKLCIGLGLAYVAMRQGQSAPVVAQMTVLGVTIGEGVAVCYMLLCMFFFRTKQATTYHMPSSENRDTKQILQRLLALAIPITISSAVMSVTDFIDMLLIAKQLQLSFGMSASVANAYYGIYTGMAVNFFNLPQTMVVALAMSVLPALAGVWAKGEREQGMGMMGTSFRVALLITVPAGIGFLILSQPILKMVYRSDVQLATTLMQILGLAVPFVALVSITNAILQAIGKPFVPLLSMCLGAVVKYAGDSILIAHPKIQICGAPISTVACYVVITVVNWLFLKRICPSLPKFYKLFSKPLGASVAMAVATLLCHAGLSAWLAPALGIWGERASTMLSLLVAVLVYSFFGLRFQILNREDIFMLPKGESIAKRFHL